MTHRSDSTLALRRRLTYPLASNVGDSIRTGPSNERSGSTRQTVPGREATDLGRPLPTLGSSRPLFFQQCLARPQARFPGSAPYFPIWCDRGAVGRLSDSSCADRSGLLLSATANEFRTPRGQALSATPKIRPVSRTAGSRGAENDASGSGQETDPCSAVRGLAR